jgi:hypothetical protein
MAEGKFLIDAEAITMRMPSAVLEVLDAWRRKQTDSLGRAEAIRRMVEQALTSTDSRPIAAEAHHKTAKMASREIDKLGANCELDAGRLEPSSCRLGRQLPTYRCPKEGERNAG